VELVEFLPICHQMVIIDRLDLQAVVLSERTVTRKYEDSPASQQEAGVIGGYYWLFPVPLLLSS
jgi:hypothetical protein